MVVHSAKSMVQAVRLAFKAGLRSNTRPPGQSSALPPILRTRIIHPIPIPQQIHSRIKLNSKFTQLLTQLSSNPIIKGAANVFLSSSASPTSTSTATSPILRNLSKVNHSFKSTKRFTSQNAFRVQTIPIRQSTCHGPGLQTARNFSSGGHRAFDLVITNAPLALRALGNELEKDAKSNGKSKGLENQSKGIRRLGSKQVKKTQKLALERCLFQPSSFFNSSVSNSSTSKSISSTQLKSKLASKDEEIVNEISKSTSILSPLDSKDEINRIEFENYWKPISIQDVRGLDSEGPHKGIETVLHLALDPNLSEILMSQPLSFYSNNNNTNHKSSSQSLDLNLDPNNCVLINQSLIQSLKILEKSYSSHKIFISRILKSLREVGLLNSYDPWLLSFENFDFQSSSSFNNGESSKSRSSFSLEIKFKGWKEKEILKMLKEKIGSELIEDFRDLMLFVEKRNQDVEKDEGSNLDDSSSSSQSQELKMINHDSGDSGDSSSDSFSSEESISQIVSNQELQDDDNFSSTFIMPQIPIETNQLQSIDSFHHHHHHHHHNNNYSDEELEDSFSLSSSPSSSLISSPNSDFLDLIQSIELIDGDLEYLENELEDDLVG